MCFPNVFQSVPTIRLRSPTPLVYLPQPSQVLDQQNASSTTLQKSNSMNTTLNIKHLPQILTSDQTISKDLGIRKRRSLKNSEKEATRTLGRLYNQAKATKNKVLFRRKRSTAVQRRTRSQSYRGPIQNQVRSRIRNRNRARDRTRSMTYRAGSRVRSHSQSRPQSRAANRAQSRTQNRGRNRSQSRARGGTQIHPRRSRFQSQAFRGRTRIKQSQPQGQPYQATSLKYKPVLQPTSGPSGPIRTLSQPSRSRTRSQPYRSITQSQPYQIRTRSQAYQSRTRSQANRSRTRSQQNQNRIQHVPNPSRTQNRLYQSRDKRQPSKSRTRGQQYRSGHKKPSANKLLLRTTPNPPSGSRTRSQLYSSRTQNQLNRSRTRNQPNRGLTQSQTRSQPSRSRTRSQPNRSRTRNRPNRGRTQSQRRSQPSRSQTRSQPNRSQTRIQPNRSQTRSQPKRSRMRSQPNQNQTRSQRNRSQTRSQPNQSRARRRTRSQLYRSRTQGQPYQSQTRSQPNRSRAGSLTRIQARNRAQNRAQHRDQNQAQNRAQNRAHNRAQNRARIQERNRAQHQARSQPNRSRTRGQQNQSQTRRQPNRSQTRSHPNRSRTQSQPNQSRTRNRDRSHPNRSQTQSQPYQSRARNRDRSKPNRSRTRSQPNQGRTRNQLNRSRAQSQQIQSRARSRDRTQPNRGRTQSQPNRSRTQSQPNRGRIQSHPNQSRARSRAPNQSRTRSQANRSQTQSQPNRSETQTQGDQSRSQSQSQSRAESEIHSPPYRITSSTYKLDSSTKPTLLPRSRTRIQQHQSPTGNAPNQNEARNQIQSISRTRNLSYRANLSRNNQRSETPVQSQNHSRFRSRIKNQTPNRMLRPTKSGTRTQPSRGSYRSTTPSLMSQRALISKYQTTGRPAFTSQMMTHGTHLLGYETTRRPIISRYKTINRYMSRYKSATRYAKGKTTNRALISTHQTTSRPALTSQVMTHGTNLAGHSTTRRPMISRYKTTNRFMSRYKSTPRYSGGRTTRRAILPRYDQTTSRPAFTSRVKTYGTNLAEYGTTRRSMISRYKTTNRFMSLYKNTPSFIRGRTTDRALISRYQTTSRPAITSQVMMHGTNLAVHRTTRRPMISRYKTTNRFMSRYTSRPKSFKGRTTRRVLMSNDQTTGTPAFISRVTTRKRNQLGRVVSYEPMKTRYTSNNRFMSRYTTSKTRLFQGQTTREALIPKYHTTSSPVVTSREATSKPNLRGRLMEKIFVPRYRTRVSPRDRSKILSNYNSSVATLPIHKTISRLSERIYQTTNIPILSNLGPKTTPGISKYRTTRRWPIISNRGTMERPINNTQKPILHKSVNRPWTIPPYRALWHGLWGPSMKSSFPVDPRTNIMRRFGIKPPRRISSSQVHRNYQTKESLRTPNLQYTTLRSPEYFYRSKYTPSEHGSHLHTKDRQNWLRYNMGSRYGHLKTHKNNNHRIRPNRRPKYTPSEHSSHLHTKDRQNWLRYNMGSRNGHLKTHKNNDHRIRPKHMERGDVSLGKYGKIQDMGNKRNRALKENYKQRQRQINNEKLRNWHHRNRAKTRQNSNVPDSSKTSRTAQPQVLVKINNVAKSNSDTKQRKQQSRGELPSAFNNKTKSVQITTPTLKTLPRRYIKNNHWPKTMKTKVIKEYSTRRPPAHRIHKHPTVRHNWFQHRIRPRYGDFGTHRKKNDYSLPSRHKKYDSNQDGIPKSGRATQSNVVVKINNVAKSRSAPMKEKHKDTSTPFSAFVDKIKDGTPIKEKHKDTRKHFSASIGKPKSATPKTEQHKHTSELPSAFVDKTKGAASKEEKHKDASKLSFAFIDKIKDAVSKGNKVAKNETNRVGKDSHILPILNQKNYLENKQKSFELSTESTTDIFGDNIYVRLGKQVALPCPNVKSKKLIPVRWKYHHKFLNNKRATTNTNGTLLITHTQRTDGGVYSCTSGRHAFYKYNLHIYTLPDISLKAAFLFGEKKCLHGIANTTTNELKRHICDTNAVLCKSIDQMTGECNGDRLQITTMIELPRKFYVPNCTIACLKKSVKSQLAKDYAALYSIVSNRTMLDRMKNNVTGTDYLIQEVCHPTRISNTVDVLNKHGVCVTNKHKALPRSSAENTNVMLNIVGASLFIMVILLMVPLVYLLMEKKKLAKKLEEQNEEKKKQQSEEEACEEQKKQQSEEEACELKEERKNCTPQAIVTVQSQQSPSVLPQVHGDPDMEVEVQKIDDIRKEEDPENEITNEMTDINGIPAHLYDTPLTNITELQNDIYLPGDISGHSSQIYKAAVEDDDDGLKVEQVSLLDDIFNYVSGTQVIGEASGIDVSGVDGGTGQDIPTLDDYNEHSVIQLSNQEHDLVEVEHSAGEQADTEWSDGEHDAPVLSEGSSDVTAIEHHAQEGLNNSEP